MRRERSIVGAVLSAVVRHFADLIIILVLLVFNAVVGFWQEYQAGNAVEALEKKLALKCRVLRDQAWQDLDSKTLVPGGVVRLEPRRSSKQWAVSSRQ
jgi:H+-transporting ATPase